MRLTKYDVDSILKGLGECVYCPISYELFLFGSRVDDSKKGGDIDLLMILSEDLLEEAQRHRHYLVAALKKYLDDQRVDLTLISNNQLASNTFFQSIKDQIIRLDK